MLEVQPSSRLQATAENRLHASRENRTEWSIAMSIDVDADAVRIFHALTVPEYLEAWISMPGEPEGSAVVASAAENGYRLDQYSAGSVALSIASSYLFCHHRKMRLFWRKTRSLICSESLVDFRLRGNFASSILELRHTAIASADEYLWHQSFWHGSLQKLAFLLRYA